MSMKASVMTGKRHRKKETGNMTTSSLKVRCKIKPSALVFSTCNQRKSIFHKYI